MDWENQSQRTFQIRYWNSYDITKVRLLSVMSLFRSVRYILDISFLNSKTLFVRFWCKRLINVLDVIVYSLSSPSPPPSPKRRFSQTHLGLCYARQIRGALTDVCRWFQTDEPDQGRGNHAGTVSDAEQRLHGCVLVAGQIAHGKPDGASVETRRHVPA